jgi:hypothetical protein
MDYELGSMVNQEWTPNAVQTKDDMPSSTTSSTSTKVSAELLTESNGNFLIWFVTNYTSTSSISAPDGYAIRKLRVTPKPEIVLKVKWGDTVNVPSGYKVSEVRTFVGYAFHSYFASPAQNEKAIAWPKKNVYFDNVEGHTLLKSATGTLGSETWPLVEVFQCTSLHGASGMYLTVGYRNSTAAWNTQERLTNGTNSSAGDYSVYLRGEDTTALNDAVNSGYPVRYLWFIWDSTQSEWFEAVWWKTPEAFRVPNDLWSFRNGAFSWLGNSEDTSSLAWYYKHDWDGFEMEGFDGVWFYVHCLYDPTPEPEPSYTEYALYKDSGNLYLQAGITSSYSGQANVQSLAKMYQDSGLTQPLAYDSSKRYVRGDYTDGVWVEQEVQDVSDMPNSTVSSLDGSTRATIVEDKDGYVYLWAITNMTLQTYFISYNGPYYIRVYDN